MTILLAGVGAVAIFASCYFLLGQMVDRVINAYRPRVELPPQYKPRFVDGEWKSGFEMTKELGEDEQAMMGLLGLLLKENPSLADTTHADYIDLWGEPHRWNPDKKRLESVSE